VLLQRVQLARCDLVDLDGVWLGMEGAHVLEEAARDRGRKGQRYADRLGQAVDHICERNADQSRDRDDDDILPQQHDENETLSSLRARRCKLSGNTHRSPRYGPPL
jgi:hypothetical protein